MKLIDGTMLHPTRRPHERIEMQGPVGFAICITEPLDEWALPKLDPDRGLAQVPVFVVERGHQ